MLKVKHNELNQVSDKIKKDSEALNIEIEKMLSEIENLKIIWNGVDALQFCNNASTYISKMKNITNAMDNMSKVMDVANKGYEEYDEEFGNALELEAENYE